MASHDREDDDEDDDDDGSTIWGSAERSAGHIRKLLSSLSNDDSDDMDGCFGDDETDECGVYVCDGVLLLKVDDKLKLDSDVSSDSQNIGTADMKPYTFKLKIKNQSMLNHY